MLDRFDLVLESVSCALCGANDYDHVLWARDWLHNLPGEFQIVQCRNCSLIYQNPRPNQTTILNYYPAEYEYAPASGSASAIKGSGLRAKLWRTIQSHYYGYPFPADDLPFVIRPFVGLYHSFYKILSLPIIRWQQSGRVLDVGCGKGEYLASLRELGWQVNGIEINPHAVSYARDTLQLDVFQGDFFARCLPSASVDVVTMWWYLEHVPNPADILKEARRVLKPDGLLLVGVPNWASIEARVLKSAWHHLDAPRHFTLFTPSTLSAMLAQAGFVIREQRMVSWLNDPAESIERLIQIKRSKPMKFPKWLRLLMAPTEWIFASFGRGSLMAVVAQPADQRF